MNKITLNQVLNLHDRLIERFGGIGGIRDEGMLDLSINSPFQTYGGELLYKDVISQSVHLGYSLVMNHPFLDGNKRIGAHAMLTNLYLNGYSLTYKQDELSDLFYDLASSNVSEKDLLKWVKAHIN